jgi:hypothetical protein
MSIKVQGPPPQRLSLPKLSSIVAGADDVQFEQLLDLIALGDRLLRTPEVAEQTSPKDLQRIASLASYARLLEVTRSIALLASHGMREELSSLFRVFLDAYFVHGNICSNSRFVGEYFRTDETTRLKLMRVASRHTDEIFKLINQYSTAERQSDLVDRIAEGKIEPLNTYNYAKSIGCDQIYDSAYRIHSAAVHTSPRCLGGYLEADDEGTILGISVGPDSVTTNQTVFDLAWFFLAATSGFVELNELGSPSELEDLRARLQASGTV